MARVRCFNEVSDIYRSGQVRRTLKTGRRNGASEHRRGRKNQISAERRPPLGKAVLILSTKIYAINMSRNVLMAAQDRAALTYCSYIRGLLLTAVTFAM